MARILIVDDEELVRETVVAIIEAAGHRACAVDGGVPCLERLDSFNPDLVITNIVMPGMEGMETIRELRRRRPHLAIIVLSGFRPSHGVDYLAMAEHLGASRSLSKPVSPRTLIDAVNTLLDGRAAGT